MLWVPYIELIFISFASNLLILVFVIFSSRKNCHYFELVVYKRENGVFLLSLLNDALD